MTPFTKVLLELELRLTDPAARQSPDELANLLADDFVEFGSSGRTYDKAATLAAMRESSARVAIEDFSAREVVPGCAVATYRARTASGASLRSSIWRREESGWRVVFHQGTPISS